MIESVLCAFVPAVVALVAIALLLASPLAQWIVDHPGERSLHATATPRFGGVGIMLGALPFLIGAGPGELRWLAAAAVGLAVVSFVDDLRPLPVSVRLPCHFAAALLAVGVAGVDTAPLALVAAAVALLGVAWTTNLYNFMDGADGLAGGMTAIGFSAYAAGAFAAGDAAVGNASLALASAALGFLAFNFPPARVFMGDAGSIPLGFLAGAIGWLGVSRGLWPWWFPPLAFSPFVVDATATLLRRLRLREPVLRAHRSHYYQRLVLGGWTHRQLALRAWIVMALAGGSALLVRDGHAAVQGAMIFVWVFAYGVLMARIDRRFPVQAGGQGPRPPGTGR